MMRKALLLAASVAALVVVPVAAGTRRADAEHRSGGWVPGHRFQRSSRVRRRGHTAGHDPDPGRRLLRQAEGEGGVADHLHQGHAAAAGEGLLRQDPHHGDHGRHVDRRAASRRVPRHVRADARPAEHAREDALLQDGPALHEGRKSLGRDPGQGPGGAGASRARRQAREEHGRPRARPPCEDGRRSPDRRTRRPRLEPRRRTTRRRGRPGVRVDDHLDRASRHGGRAGNSRRGRPCSSCVRPATRS